MSVTKPTFMPEPLDDAPPLAVLVVLVLLAAGAAAAELLLLLLLLLPHAASPSASAAIAIAAAPGGLILPVTTTPFRQNRMRNHNPYAGRPGSRLTCSSPMTTNVRALLAHVQMLIGDFSIGKSGDYVLVCLPERMDG
jgi:hypothetical protein